MTLQDLKIKIEDRSAKIAVIGLGYVGLPVACEFARVGFQVIGVDIVRTGLKRSIVEYPRSKVMSQVWMICLDL